VVELGCVVDGHDSFAAPIHGMTLSSTDPLASVAGNGGHVGHLMNLEMLLDLGGRERTEPEYREFLSKAGFELTRVVQTASPVSVVESKPT
jgi:hypothetical protein